MSTSLAPPPVDLVDFASMEHRIRYLVSAFGDHVAGKVLDVGCAQRYLASLRPDLEYTGIDMGGEPDLRVNLEAVERLPFDDRAFDTVICCDVLEHLNNLHHMFGELVRVSGRRLVLSLPNCWTAARMRIERGHGEIGLYGLPADPPEDRHKWFFSLTQGQAFLRAMADRHGLKVLDLRATEKPRPGVVRALRRMRHPNIEHYLNRYAHTLWVAYERLDG